MVIHWRLAAVAAVMFGSQAALAEDGITLESRSGSDRPAPAARAVAAGGPIVFGDFVSIQCNVDALGQDIVGDAANEPSIAVDPTNRDRIVVGWRQFDNIVSNFREAGWAYSHDGGLTWTASELESGIFRSDPVLAAASDGSIYYLSLEVGANFLCDVFTSVDGGVTWPVKTSAFGGDKSWLAVDNTNGPGAGHLYQAWNTGGNQFFPNQFARSADGNASWEDPVEYDPGGGQNAAQPVFGQCTVGPDGAVYVAGAMNSANTDQFWVVRSTNAEDSGQTPTFDQISEPDLGGNLRLSVGPNPNGLLGQVNVAVDASGGANHGDVYVLCSVNPPGADPMDVHFIRSDDSGATWSAPVRVNDDPGNSAWQWFGTMSVAPNGRIDVVFNDTRNSGQTNISQLFYSSSDDGGLNWSANIPLSPAFDSFVGWPNQNKLGDYYDMVSDNAGADVIYAATHLGGQDVYYLRIDVSSECPWDLDGNGQVATADLLDLLGQWGSDPGGPPDFDGNGNVATADLLKLLGEWGACP